jgi:hypothetical protein
MRYSGSSFAYFRVEHKCSTNVSPFHSKQDMNKIISTILFVMLIASIFQGCINDKSRKSHKWTFKVCDSLYTEIFSTFGQGAWGGDRNGQWLTDSTDFRLFLGAFDEGYGRILVECKNDSILIIQFPDDLDVNKHLESPETRAYLLKDLRKMNNLNDF